MLRGAHQLGLFARIDAGGRAAKGCAAAQTHFCEHMSAPSCRMRSISP